VAPRTSCSGQPAHAKPCCALPYRSLARRTPRDLVGGTACKWWPSAGYAARICACELGFRCVCIAHFDVNPCRQRYLSVYQDPEGILAAPRAGHISRRMVAKQAAENEELKEQMAKAREEARQELTQKREVGMALPPSPMHNVPAAWRLSEPSLPSAEPQAARVALGAHRIPAGH
jgi:hypothetical protein